MKPGPVLTPRKPEKLFAQMDQILCLHFSLLTGRNLLHKWMYFFISLHRAQVEKLGLQGQREFKGERSMKILY